MLWPTFWVTAGFTLLAIACTGFVAMRRLRSISEQVRSVESTLMPMVDQLRDDLEITRREWERLEAAMAEDDLDGDDDDDRAPSSGGVSDVRR